MFFMSFQQDLTIYKSGWYAKEQATFSDALAAVRQHLWEVEYFSTSTPDLQISIAFS